MRLHTACASHRAKRFHTKESPPLVAGRGRSAYHSLLQAIHDLRQSLAWRTKLTLRQMRKRRLRQPLQLRQRWALLVHIDQPSDELLLLARLIEQLHRLHAVAWIVVA